MSGDTILPSPVSEIVRGGVEWDKRRDIHIEPFAIPLENIWPHDGTGYSHLVVIVG